KRDWSSDVCSSDLFFEQLAGPQAWAWVWIALGVLCLVSTLADRLVPAAVGGTITIHAAWGLSFLAEWVFGDSSRAWVSALGYIAVTGLFLWAISRGQRTEVNLKFHGDRDA